MRHEQGAWLIEGSCDCHVAATWLLRDMGGVATAVESDWLMFEQSLDCPVARAPNVLPMLGTSPLLAPVLLALLSSLSITSSSSGVSSGFGALSPSPSEQRIHFFLRLERGRECESV